MGLDFRWNEWNLDHATRHGVSVDEIQHVMFNAARPYPRRYDAGKWIVIGRGNDNREVQVIFTYDDDDDDDDARDVAYVVHAMPTRGHRRRKR